MNYKRLSYALTEIVGGDLYYYDNMDKLDYNNCSAEDIMMLRQGWITQYQNDPLFNNKVKSTVSKLLAAIQASEN